MRVLIRRAAVVAAVTIALAVPAGVASASGPPVLSWAPTTSAGTYDYGTLNAGQTASSTFTLTNFGGTASGTLTIVLSGPAAFNKTTDTCTARSLGPNKSCSVTVTYSPTAPHQSESGTLTANGEHATASLTLYGAAGKASPAIATHASPPAGLVGTKLMDTATLSGGSSPTGTITFTLSPFSCIGAPPVDTETVTVNGSGTYTTPVGYTPTQAHTYYWTASYSGDTNNNPAATPCGAEPVTIGP
jgi:HYDIN/CFA65/VesB-like, Ig-like domain